MIIRKAQKTDLDKIKKLNTDIFHDNGKFDKDAIDAFSQTSEGEKYFKQALEDKKGIFLVAEEGQSLLGYVNGSAISLPYRKSRYFEVCNLGVLPNIQRKGVGTILLNKFASEAKEKGFDKIYLNCYAKNIEAIKFYKASGYETIDICMEKNI